MPSTPVFSKLFFFSNHSLRSDVQGDGAFGAPRGAHTHKGVDLLATPGLFVKLSVPGTVTQIGYAYNDDTRYNSYHIDLGNDTTLKLLYVSPLFKVGDTIQAGQTIGTMQNITAKWGKTMKNHLHVEMYQDGELIDPTTYLF